MIREPQQQNEDKTLARMATMGEGTDNRTASEARAGSDRPPTPDQVSNQPRRIQRKRSKGWRMPDNAVYVGRPTKWGNPWSPKGYYAAGYPGTLNVAIAACVENYRAWMTRTVSTWTGDVPDGPLKHPDGSVHMEPVDVAPLRGKHLACWCPLDQPCHADVLLKLANEAQR